MLARRQPGNQNRQANRLVNRLLEISWPDCARETNELDLAGKLLPVRDARGHSNKKEAPRLLLCNAAAVLPSGSTPHPQHSDLSHRVLERCADRGTHVRIAREPRVDHALGRAGDAAMSASPCVIRCGAMRGMQSPARMLHAAGAGLRGAPGERQVCMERHSCQSGRRCAGSPRPRELAARRNCGTWISGRRSVGTTRCDGAA